MSRGGATSAAVPATRRPAAWLLRGVGRSGLTMGARAAYWLSRTTLLDRLRGRYGCCLLFHRVAPAMDWPRLPNRGFHLDADFLDALLTRLRRTGWAILSVDESLAALRRGSCDRFVNFSIDDVYRDTYDITVPLFRAHGVPVTLYVTTAIPDGTEPLWRAGLETVLLERDQVTIPGDPAPVRLRTDADRRRLFQHLQRSWEADDPLPTFDLFCRLNRYDGAALRQRHATDWQMLAELADSPNVEIGSHTVTHARIAMLPTSEALTEMIESRHRLRQKLGVDVRHFAFPYGQPSDCGERDFLLARQAGYASAATTSHGLLSGRDGVPFVLPRNSLNGEHRDFGLVAAHLSGLTGMATGIRRFTTIA